MKRNRSPTDVVGRNRRRTFRSGAVAVRLTVLDNSFMRVVVGIVARPGQRDDAAPHSRSMALAVVRSEHRPSAVLVDLYRSNGVSDDAVAELVREHKLDLTEKMDAELCPEYREGIMMHRESLYPECGFAPNRTMENWLSIYAMKRPEGVVAYVVNFPDPHGKSVVCWNTTPGSTTTFDSMSHVETIHGHGETEFIPIQKFDVGKPMNNDGLPHE